MQSKKLRLTVSDHGAEIKSLVNLETGQEYMWQGDPAYWKRTAPILFPLVGNYRDKTSYYGGKEYHMSQHGFARDMEFELCGQNDVSLNFLLKDTEETREKYPFAFKLYVNYVLHDDFLSVTWNVENCNDKDMYFSIGGHPAFNCNLETDSLLFHVDDQYIQGPLVSGIIENDGSGCLSDRQKVLPLEEGVLKLTPSLFDDDALILEHPQARQVTLLDKDRKAVLELDFRFFSPSVMGIWSSPGKNAPFVCIEPWHGRTDRVDFSQKLEEREYGKVLRPEEAYVSIYNIKLPR